MVMHVCANLHGPPCPSCCHRAPWIISTWLWGSPTTRYKRYDPSADSYSLSFSFLEVTGGAGPVERW